MSKPPIKRTGQKAYEWPPKPLPKDAYAVPRKNPIQSILTALPIIMLVAGLYLYYHADSAQSHGAPIRLESVQLDGVFTGLSVVQTGPEGRHYLWVTHNDESRGVRIQPAQALLLDALERDADIVLQAAPTVAGSRTVWLWYLAQHGNVLIDNEALLE